MAFWTHLVIWVPLGANFMAEFSFQMLSRFLVVLSVFWCPSFSFSVILQSCGCA